MVAVINTATVIIVRNQIVSFQGKKELTASNTNAPIAAVHVKKKTILCSALTITVVRQVVTESEWEVLIIALPTSAAIQVVTAKKKVVPNVVQATIVMYPDVSR